VYEWTGDLAKPDAARVVPVSLFIDGHLEDAGVYLARPIPLAIQTGTVYSVEVAGEPKGTVDIDYARNVVTRRSATDESPVAAWYGYGSFLPPVPPPKLANLKASKTTSTLSSSVTLPADDDDRPHMIRRPDTAPSDTASSTTPAATASDDDPDRPTLRKREGKQDAARGKSTGSVTPVATSLNDDPDRPSMQRGKPLAMVSAAELKSLPPNLHQMVAVSDAATRSEHVFNREWASPTEQPQTLVALRALAQPRLASYLSGNRLRSIPNSALTNEQLTPYMLSYDGLPTFVYTAEYPVTAGGPVYVTLVAQRLASDQFQVSLVSITDAGHLDRTPWLRLIDAVDPDASHRASLLFELRAQSSRQFALYRIVSATAEQTFVTGPVE
jgi:hypothetical protein